ncbi:MAG TPA: 4Fe-4S binding protein [Pseudobacteroides sp.]|uniref:ATP-binding protein n=1 Tax=Pseudobacteroides sp. TaxID=1968840 RepID=UPI002F93F296
MKRKIISINEDKCNGCGLCINACHEGALQLIDGKAKLITDSYCDGLGACLPDCPTGAMEIIEREAAEFDEELVKARMEEMSAAQKKAEAKPLACGCPGMHAKTIEKKAQPVQERVEGPLESQLRQWPCQIKLVPVNAPYFNNAHLLVAADCTAYAYANIHQEFMKNKITIIGCPKLDDIDYAEKLGEIIKRNEIKSVTVLRMEVPCCGGIVAAVKKALIESGKMVPWSVHTIATDGVVIDD